VTVENTMQRFEGRTVIITGAAHAVGRHPRTRVAAEGAKVVVADVLEDECRWLTRELPHTIRLSGCD
jgi:NAD(P)-dependent dehydrogenase (short-subunit alcohol dehydrogenase family)